MEVPAADEFASVPYVLESQVVVGDYEKIEELGRGDKSVVYLARDKQGKLVALKEMLPREKMHASPEVSYYFDSYGVSILAQNEKRFGEMLDHPHIIKIEDLITQTVGGVVITYVVMEYVDGKTLGEWENGDLTELEAKQCALEMIDALSYAMQKGLIHYDLYSSNIMLTRDHHLKLIDIDSFEELVDEEDQTLRGFLNGLNSTICNVLMLGEVHAIDALEDIFTDPYLVPFLEQDISASHQDVFIWYLEQASKAVLF